MRFLIIAMFAALLSSLALANQPVSFNVDGANPDGSAYRGTVTLTEILPSEAGKGSRYLVSWNTGGARVVGIGVMSEGSRNVLAVAYAIDGVPGIALLTERGDKMSGIWTMNGAPGLGTETWTLAR